MPAKNTPNGFYIYMQAERKKIKAQTNRAPSMQEMAALCAATWKSLSAAEKERYEHQAKQEKHKMRTSGDRDKYRMDNQRQIIADRKDATAEDKKRRAHEIQNLIKTWPGQDVREIQFHVIDFQVMYDERTEDHHLPMEVGMVCFTLKDGIIKFLHQFIDPGDAPQGNMHLAIKHSDNTHKIPLHFEKADRNFLGLWMQMEKFLAEDPLHDEFPPIFCLSTHRVIVESCLEYTHYRASTGEPNRLLKVYCLEDLIISLMNHTGKMDRKPSERQIHDALRQNRWDYTSSIRCSYHEEMDCAYCSLSIVRRYSFALFDVLSELLEFKLTKNHLPDETQHLTVIQSSSFGRSKEFSRGPRFQDRGDMSSKSSVRSSSPPSFVAPAPQMPSPGGAWGGPKVNRVEIALSDEEGSDSDDEDTLDSDEIRSTADQYNLKELRKPKTPSMLQAPGVSGIVTSVGRGQSYEYNQDFPALGSGAPVRPMIRPQMGGDGPQNLAMRMGVPVGRSRGYLTRPPPGLASLPGSSAFSEMGAAPPRGISPALTPAPFRGVAPNPAMTTFPSTNTALQPAQATGISSGLQPGAPCGRGRGSVRGRGMPPQVPAPQAQGQDGEGLPVRQDGGGLLVGRGYSR